MKTGTELMNKFRNMKKNEKIINEINKLDLIECRRLAILTRNEMVLEELLKKDDVGIKIRIASNCLAPKILDKLALELDIEIKKAVAENENTSVNTLEKLASDEDDEVREIAKTNIKNQNGSSLKK